MTRRAVRRPHLLGTDWGHFSEGKKATGGGKQYPSQRRAAHLCVTTYQDTWKASPAFTCHRSAVGRAAVCNVRGTPTVRRKCGFLFAKTASKRNLSLEGASRLSREPPIAKQMVPKPLVVPGRPPLCPHGAAARCTGAPELCCEQSSVYRNSRRRSRAAGPFEGCLFGLIAPPA